VTQAAMKCLLQYDWPGNVRELENCVARALTLGGRQTIDVSDLPPIIARVADADEMGAAHAALTSTALADLERATIERVYEQAHGDKALAARMLGISRATIYRKLKQFGIAQKEAEVQS
jgi:DNA-binding NtrC family response regulator